MEIFLNWISSFTKLGAVVRDYVAQNPIKHSICNVPMHLCIETDGCLRAARAPATSPARLHATGRLKHKMQFSCPSLDLIIPARAEINVP